MQSNKSTEAKSYPRVEWFDHDEHEKSKFVFQIVLQKTEQKKFTKYLHLADCHIKKFVCILNFLLRYNCFTI